jgi:hypothetical protein
MRELFATTADDSYRHAFEHEAAVSLSFYIVLL